MPRRFCRALQTEARTLEQVLNVHSEVDHTPVVEQITVEIGYETALGAALGEDLDASLDEAAAVRWGSALAADGDPALPGSAKPLLDVVTAPKELHRRLSSDRTGVPGRRSALAVKPEARSTAGEPGRGPLALGRVCCRGQRTNTGGPTSGAEESPGGTGRRN
jgi:hypothetical protein